MNRIIIEQHELDAQGFCTLTDQRAEHLRTWLHAAPGQQIKVGLLQGNIGLAEVITVDKQQVILRPMFTEPALAPWFDAIVALPRPRAIKRLWPQLTAMGVRHIYLTNAAKVEKSYFSSHALDEAAYRPLLIEGLMQAGTTQLPEISIIKHFTALFDLIPATPLRLLAHPGLADYSRLRGQLKQAHDLAQLPILAIGPDGGWTDQECDTFFAQGFQPFALGQRPLRTDTAAIALLGALQVLRSEVV